MLRLALASILAVATPSIAAAQVRFIDEVFAYDVEHPAAGAWLGTVEDGDGRPQFASVVIAQDPAGGGTGGWTVTAMVPSLEAYWTPGTDVTVRGRDVGFTIEGAGASPRFGGTVSEDGQRLEGRAAAPGGAAPRAFVLARTPRPGDLPEPQRYTGPIKGPTRGDLALTIVIARTPGGHWVGAMDFPVGRIEAFPLVNVERAGGALRADALLRRTARIDARFADDDTRLTGSFRQGPLTFEIDLARADAPPDAPPGAPGPAPAAVLPAWVQSSWMLRRHLAPRWALGAVDVVDVREGVVRRGVNIVIAGDVIESVSPAAPPPGIEVRPLPGRWVIPGLFDLHAHIQPFDPEAGADSPAEVAILAALLAHGVTTVRALPLTSEFALDVAGRVATGALSGPRIIPAGAILEQRPQRTSFGFGDPDTARRWVERDAMLGCRWIKVYNAMDPPSLRAIVETAHARGLRVCGHTEEVPPREASEIGLDTIEHVVSIPLSCLRAGAGPPPSGGLPERIAWRWANVDDAERRRLIADLVARQTGLVPTLVVLEAMISGGGHDGEAMDPSLAEPMIEALGAGARFAVDLHRAGGLVGLGTDFPIDGVAAGVSVHRELELLVELGGATPLEALRIATIASARILGLESMSGAVEPGFAADLVVLSANPLDDIAATGRIELIVHDGRVIAKAP